MLRIKKEKFIDLEILFVRIYLKEIIKNIMNIKSIKILTML